MIYRNTWAEVNLSAIYDNAMRLQALLPKNRKMMGVVKADGYGHGSVKVANVLLSAGVDFLMVALPEEAVKLREAGIESPILVISRTNPTFAQVAAEQNITLSVFDKEWVETVRRLHLVKPLSVHVELETGMNRTGICTEAGLLDIINAIEGSKNIHLTGAYTHFAAADEIKSSLYNDQKARYHKMLRVLQKNHNGTLVTHIGNSAAGIQYSDDMLDYTRFGVALYGIYPSNDVKTLDNVALKQAMSLYSELIQVKRVKKGEVISYGGTYEAQSDEWIGTIPIGYADGWRRNLQGFHVLVNGEKCPIVGRICMDGMMVRLSQAYKVGQRVTLIGEDNGAFISIDDVARHIGTIGYEIPTMLTARIPRIYTGNSEKLNTNHL